MIPIIDVDLPNFLVVAILRILGGVAILLIGRWLAGLARRTVHATLQRTQATPSLAAILERSVFYGTVNGCYFVP